MLKRWYPMNSSKSFNKYIIICIVLVSFIIFYIYNFIFSLNKVASIGIIGGADGPTSIYMTARWNPKFIYVALIGLSIFVLFKLIKNNIKYK